MAQKSDIGKKIFFLKNDSQEIFEAYTINNVVEKKMLGRIDLISNNFVWNSNVNPNFIKRRSDFHGIVLKGMVEFYGSNMNADASYVDKAIYYPNNETCLLYTSPSPRD